MGKKRILLIGWDAADWKVIDPLLAKGEMPNLAKLIAGGVRGNMATIYPPLSPMLWTSISTGKRAYKHGIHGFSEPLPDGSSVRPITILGRKTKALWNILNQNGWRSIVVGWWPSHPAEPINGVMVSNHFQKAAGEPDKTPPPLPMGTVHPATLAGPLGEMRVNPMELPGEVIRLFVPEYQKVDQSKDKRLHSLGKIVAETMSILSVATELLATQEWDFAGIYFDGIDHFGHGFMQYHPPRLPWVEEKDFEVYQHVMANAYRYHDAMLGTLLKFADKETTVILMSDHGFHPDHLRPGYIPAEPAGPAVEHRHFGICCMSGPAVRVNEQLFGATILDICPTILTLCGLPPGKDMDGKVLLNAFKEPPKLEPIESWDDVAGEAGTHPPDAQLDPVASAEAFKQLVELGYVAPPGKDAKETVDETVRELKYNLSRASRDGGRVKDAATILRELWTRWPKEHRFGIELIECLTALGDVKLRGETLAELERLMEEHSIEAKAELEKRKEKKKADEEKKAEDEKKKDDKEKETADPKKAEEAKKPEGYFGQSREQFEERKLRELSHPPTLLLEWLHASQSLLAGDTADARKKMEKLMKSPHMTWGMAQQVAGALAQLGDWEPAQATLEQALKVDSDNPMAHARLAEIHFKAKRWEPAIEAATESLSLLYFQPSIHALLGEALMEMGRFTDAETELKVAIALHPRHPRAHTLLGKIYRDHLNRPTDAFVHEGMAQSLKTEVKLKRQARATAASKKPKTAESAAPKETPPVKREPAPPFGTDVDRDKIITVVAGLPRSGTSMMMQLLAAGGLVPLTDGQRAADADNPLGYFEFAKATDLAHDRSWIPEARGKVVKLVAQLLPQLPPQEHCHVIFMQRNLAEIVASQTAMLARLDRKGSALNDRQLMDTYTAQLRRVEEQLARRKNIRVLYVDYAALLADPRAGVQSVAQFLGSDSFKHEPAIAAVHPELRRQKTD